MKVTKADKYFSNLVRHRDGWRCSVCGTQYGPDCGASLQCSHFIGRANKAVRFDPDNASAKCAACHFRMEHHPILFATFIVNRLGKERMADLVIRSNRSFKFDKATQAHITKRLEQMWHIASTTGLKEFPSPYPAPGELPDPLPRKARKPRKAKPRAKRKLPSRPFPKAHRPLRRKFKVAA